MRHSSIQQRAAQGGQTAVTLEGMQVAIGKESLSEAENEFRETLVVREAAIFMAQAKDTRREAYQMALERTMEAGMGRHMYDGVAHWRMRARWVSSEGPLLLNQRRS